MEITETRVSPVDKPSGRLKGFASVTFDGVFVVRGIRIIEGDNGLFIAMPNRKTEFRCPGCGGWNVFHAKFCNRCGKEITMSQPHEKNEDDPKNYHDIVHPINNEFREIIQSHILNEYQSETQGRKTL